MRISDWSSDVCSSDLGSSRSPRRQGFAGWNPAPPPAARRRGEPALPTSSSPSSARPDSPPAPRRRGLLLPRPASAEWRLASRAELLGGHHFQRRDIARPALRRPERAGGCVLDAGLHPVHARLRRSEEHTSDLQSLMRISYAVFCLKK